MLLEYYLDKVEPVVVYKNMLAFNVVSFEDNKKNQVRLFMEFEEAIEIAESILSQIENKDYKRIEKLWVKACERGRLNDF